MIVVRLKGGLGNQMFQYALGRVLSIKNNTELLFNIEAYEDKTPRPFKNAMPVRDLQLDVFTIAGRVAQKSEIPWLYRMYGKGAFMLCIDAVRRRIFRHNAQELSFRPFTPRMLELGSNSYLDGFFQSPKYFEGYELIIRNDFTLKNIPGEAIRVLAEEISKHNSVCVHLRRGDYVGNKAHEVVGMEYYKEGITYLGKNTAIEKIYVFSDDIEWCKNNLIFEFPTTFVGQEYVGHKDEGHMYLMSRCRHFIIANSSFSWWAAWLAECKEKIVVCPKQWFPDGSINTSDLLPEGWIRI